MPEPNQKPQSSEPQAPTGPGAAGEPQAPAPAEQKILSPDGVKVEDAGTLRKKVLVTVPADKIEAKRQEMFGELAHTAQVPGFRIGRAPHRLIEKRFGREIGDDVRNALVGASLGEAIQQANLKVLGEPHVELEKIELPEKGDLQYSFEVEVAPEFELPDLAGIPVRKTAVEVNEQRVDQYLDQWRHLRATYEATGEAAAEGDALSVDAKVSGEGIDPVERKDLAMRVAPGQVEGLPLLDLGQALAGKKAGDSATLTVKVPQAHPNEAWRGKEATVEVAVKQVRRRNLPAVNEEFAKGMGFASVAELREQVRKNLEVQTSAETRRSMRDQVARHLLENVRIELPEGVAARHAAQVLQRRYVDLMHRGMPREQIDEHLTELQAAAVEESQRSLKLSFILAKVAEREKIEVSEDEVNARVAEMARQYNRRPERLRQELASDGTIDQVRSSLQEEKALEKLLETAQVTEGPPEPPAPAEKPRKPEKAEKGAKAEKAEEAEKSEKAEKAQAKKAPAKKAEPRKAEAKKPAAKAKKEAAKPAKPEEKKESFSGKKKPKGKSAEK